MATLGIRHAVRRLWRDRTLTMVATGILALGIGANTALFSVVDAVLLKPLPYPDAERLVTLRIFDPQFQDRYPSFPVNAAHIAAWQEHCGSCEGFAVIDTMTTTLTGAGDTEQLDAATVNAGYFGVFGIAPELGRGFLSSEEQPGRNAVAMLGHAFWRRRFGGDPAVIGRPIVLDGRPVVVVGVLPSRAPLPGPEQLGDLVGLPRAIDIYRPIALPPEALRSSGDLNYGVVAKVRSGVTAAALRSELDALEPSVSSRTGDDGRKRALVQPLHETVVRHARGPLTLLFAATAAVLLIVCVNLANLLLARHAGRRREAAIRTALGASRTTLIVNGLVESLLLSGAGGVLGAGLALGLIAVIAASAPPALPALNAFVFSVRVLAFCLGTAMAAGLIVGILPALRSSRVDPGDALKAGSYTTTDDRGSGRARRTLVGVQAAIGTALLVTTGLLVLSFVRLSRADKGFDTAGILTVDVALPTSIFTTATEQLQFFDAAVARVRGLPGVTDVALTSRLPLRGEATVNVLSYPDDLRPTAARPLANYRYVTPGYFAAIGTPLLKGRTFRDTDRGRQVVVLSASAAQSLWPGQDAIGRTVRTGGYLGALSEVIGVAADSRAVDLTRANVLFTYLPYWVRGPSSGSLVIRTRVPPASLGAAVRRAVWEVDRQVAIPRIDTMDDIVEVSISDRRFQLSLMLGFGCAAALLAALGVYGVVTYSVTRRVREMAIRVALGAAPADIRRLVIAEGLQPVAVGLAAGLFVSLGIGRAISTLLFDVRSGDPLVMTGAAAVLLTATLVGCAGPARRASAGPGMTLSLR